MTEILDFRKRVRQNIDISRGRQMYSTVHDLQKWESKLLKRKQRHYFGQYLDILFFPNIKGFLGGLFSLHTLTHSSNLEFW